MALVVGLVETWKTESGMRGSLGSSTLSYLSHNGVPTYLRYLPLRTYGTGAVKMWKVPTLCAVAVVEANMFRPDRTVVRTEVVRRVPQSPRHLTRYQASVDATPPKRPVL